MKQLLIYLTKIFSIQAQSDTIVFTVSPDNIGVEGNI